MNIQISPFYLQANLLGLTPNSPFASALGSFTRLFLILGFIALAAASVRPYAWWRQITVYFGLTSLVEAYLSFLLLYNILETALLAEYNVIPPYAGTSHLQASILGLDLQYYPNPLVTAGFSLPFYLGFLGFGLVASRMILQTTQNMRRMALKGISGILGSISGGLSTGLREVYLSPPYQHVWLSSEDRELNPLGADPDQLTDDQLIVSFEKLYKAVEPGGIVDIILPAWATHVSERFQRLGPYVGFTIEKSELIYRTQGIPETELQFGKPAPQTTTTPTESTEVAQEITNEQIVPPPIASSRANEFEQPPVQETIVEPAWIHVKMTPLERSILKAAVNVLRARGEPVPHRELLNQVYLDLVDKKIDFDSARQIETTLLNHSGSEVIIVEVKDETNGRLVKKWWLGETRVATDRKPSLPFLRAISRRARHRTLTVPKLLRKWERKPRYKPKRKTDEE